MARKRKNGEGTLRKRKDGRWEGRIVVAYDENGLTKTKNVTAKSKSECLEKLDKLKTECGIVSGKARSDMPFGDWIDLWYKTYSKPSLRITIQLCYEQRIYKHIIPKLGKIPLNKLQQSDLQQFYAYLKKNGRLTKVELYGAGLSDRMVRSCHTTCRTALEKAVNEGLIYANPAIGCKLPPKKAGEMKVLTHEEMQRFLIQAKENDFYELALLELATGMRRGEISALKWSDLNFKTGELHIQRQVYHVAGGLHISSPKTKSSDRTIILPMSVVNVLREHKANTDSEWIFPSPVKDGEPIDPQSVYRKMRKVLERAQCKQIRFHDLRHPYVKHTTKIFSLRLMDFQAQAYPDARRKTRGACQLLRVGQSRSPVRPLYNRKRFSCLPPQSKMSWILYAISMRLSGYTSTRSISISASSVVSASASKIALDASFRLSCRACSSCFCFACANTAA